jgi:hypothetical protein
MLKQSQKYLLDDFFPIMNTQSQGQDVSQQRISKLFERPQYFLLESRRLQ